MYIRNDLHMKLHAEDYIRAQLKEAENYRMLNQLRKHRQNAIPRSFHPLIGRLGRALISLGERLESSEVYQYPREKMGGRSSCWNSAGLS